MTEWAHTELLFIMMGQGIKGRQGENKGKKNIIENFLKSSGVSGLEKPRCEMGDDLDKNHE